jgi:hypothetical protein
MEKLHKVEKNTKLNSPLLRSLTVVEFPGYFRLPHDLECALVASLDVSSSCP